MKWDKENPFLIFRESSDGANYAVFRASVTALSYDGDLRYQVNETVASSLPRYEDGMKLLYDYGLEGSPWSKDKIYACRFEHVPLELTYMGFARGRSAVTVFWLDETTDIMYPMFMKDLSNIITENMVSNPLCGHFTAVKRGANYGIVMDDLVE